MVAEQETVTVLLRFCLESDVENLVPLRSNVRKITSAGPTIEEVEGIIR